jgi:hypothetical protein
MASLPAQANQSNHKHLIFDAPQFPGIADMQSSIRRPL